MTSRPNRWREAAAAARAAYDELHTMLEQGAEALTQEMQTKFDELWSKPRRRAFWISIPLRA